MNITTAQIDNNWVIVVTNAYGEPLASFELCDEDNAYSFFLSQLNSDELAAERERVAVVESGWVIAAEDAANRRLSYCN
jgi:hypothetical protein